MSCCKDVLIPDGHYERNRYEWNGMGIGPHSIVSIKRYPPLTISHSGFDT